MFPRSSLRLELPSFPAVLGAARLCLTSVMQSTNQRQIHVLHMITKSENILHVIAQHHFIPFVTLITIIMIMTFD